MRARRPSKRVDCLPGGGNAQRPCPYVSCKWSIWNELAHGGSGAVSSTQKRRLPNNVDPTSLSYSCFLDLAERGNDPGTGKGAGMTLEQAGSVLNLTRERVRQIEAVALDRIRDSGLAVEAHELMMARDAGQLDGAAPWGFVHPAPIPVFTLAERRKVDRGFLRITKARGRCKREECTRMARPSGGNRAAGLTDGYCSIACAEKDGVAVRKIGLRLVPFQGATS